MKILYPREYLEIAEDFLKKNVVCCAHMCVYVHACEYMHKCMGMCLCLCVSVSVCDVCMCTLQRQEESAQYSGAGLTDSCEPNDRGC